MKLSEIDSVLILGCGWVGTELAKILIDNDIKVFGTTRSDEKAEKFLQLNIKPLILELDKSYSQIPAFPSVDAVIISISPGRGPERKNYPSHMKYIGELLGSSNQHVIMFSSTSAYNGKTGKVSEPDALPDSEHDNIILAAEGELRSELPNSVILRLGGLFGSDRHPVNYLAGREDISDGDAPVNLVHRKDVINASIVVIGNSVKGEIFNVVAPHHPQKKDLYAELAKKLGLEIPTFNPGGSDGKLVDGSKIGNELNFIYSRKDLFDINLKSTK